MALAHDTDIAVVEQSLGAHFGSDGLLDDTGLQIDAAIAQRPALLVGLAHEAQPDIRGGSHDPRHELGPEILHETFSGAQGEGPLETRKIEPLRRTQHGAGFLHERTDRFAESQGPGRRD